MTNDEKPRRSPIKARLVLALVAVVALLLTLGFLRPAAHSDSRDSSSEPGLTYIHDVQSQVPWSIHIVKIDRSRKDLAYYTPLARDKILGISRLSEQARVVPAELGRAVAGVNGDFYERDNPTYAGDPRGLQIVNGELVSEPDVACVWFDAAANPHVDEVKGDFKVTWPDGRKSRFSLNRQRLPNMAVLYTSTYGPSTRVNGGRDLILEKEGDGPWLPLTASQTYRARVREVQSSANTAIPPGTMLLSLGPQFMGSSAPELTVGAVLELSTATTPDLKGVKVAVAGGPALITKGKPFSAEAPVTRGAGGYREGSKYERHPRSAVGWNATHLFLITVDGRQPGLSVGMTLAELSDYLVKLGCTDGMNFDGGASASMWMSGKIINNPCQGERPVANSLLILRKSAD